MPQSESRSADILRSDELPEIIYFAGDSVTPQPINSNFHDFSKQNKFRIKAQMIICFSIFIQERDSFTLTSLKHIGFSDHRCVADMI